jgi:hypothetical protein
MPYTFLGLDSDKNRIEVNKPVKLLGIYILGNTGMGKTVLLESMIMQSITQQTGVCVIDPLGGLVNRLLTRIPATRLSDVIWLDLNNAATFPFGLNLYSCRDPKDILDVQRHVDIIMHLWEKIFGISRDTPLLSDYMSNLARTLLANPGHTMAEIPLVLMDDIFRSKMLGNVTDPGVLLFWKNFEGMSKYSRNEEVRTVMRRINEFMQPLVRNIIGQEKTSINLRDIMDQGKILLISLDPQLEETTSLLGGMIIGSLLMAAYSRTDIPNPNNRRQFDLFVDEADRYATSTFKQVFDQCRQFGLSTTLATQNRSYMNLNIPGLAKSVLQAATTICFQIIPPDSIEMSGKYSTRPPEPKEEVTEEPWGDEEIKTPVKDVIKHLLSGGSHPDPVVDQFATGILQTVKAKTGKQDEADFVELNRLLYLAMTGTPIAQLIPRVTLMRMVLQKLGWGDYGVALDAGGEDKQRAFVKWWRGQPEALQEVDNEARLRLRDFRLDELRMLLRKVESLYDNYVFDILHPNANGLPVVSRWYPGVSTNTNTDTILPPEEWTNLVRGGFLKDTGVNFIREPPFQWFHLDTALLAWKNDKLLPGQEAKFYSETDLIMVVEQEIQAEKAIFLNFTTTLKQVMAALAKHPITVGSGQYRPIIRQVKHMPAQKSHTERQNEIGNQLSQLPPFVARVKLNAFPPNLKSKVCHICGKSLAKNETQCDVCQVPLLPEYVIDVISWDDQQLMRNPRYIPPNTPLAPRKQAIIQKNVQDGFLRERTIVEAEIAARQSVPPVRTSLPPKNPPAPAGSFVPFNALWKTNNADIPVTIIGILGKHHGVTYYLSQGSSTGIPENEITLLNTPAPVAKTSPNNPLIPPGAKANIPPSSRKRAINTPARKQCPSCKAQNTLTALFCNMCGSKL